MSILPEHGLARIARRQGGCFTLEQAATAGLTAHVVRRARADGRWQPLLPTVYAAGATPVTQTVAEWATLLWLGPRAALSEFSAAADHRLGAPVPRTLSPTVWVAVPRGRVPRPPERSPAGFVVEVHRTRHPESTLGASGRRVVGPARTVVDLARYLDRDALGAVFLTAVQRGLCTPEEVAARGELVRGRAGSALAREVAAVFEPAFESILGAEMHQAFRRAGVPLRSGVVLTLADGGAARPDGYLDALRLAVEADGWAWHGSALQVAADKARDRRLLKVGVLTVRYDTVTIRRFPAAMVQDLREVARRRAVDLGVALPWAA